MKEFKCLTEATELYKMAKQAKLKAFMQDQLLRASSSIALNLAEGNARRTQKADQVGGMIYALNRSVTDTVKWD